MSIWNPLAEVSFANDESHFPTEKSEDLVPYPPQEAARTAALKRLRHNLVTMCRPRRPPVLTLERWLARAALYAERTDPLLPTSAVVCEGLVHDLARLDRSKARFWATSLTQQALEAAEKVAAIGPTKKESITTPPRDDELAQQIKQGTKAVKKASKAAQQVLLLKLDTRNQMEENTTLQNASVLAALWSLRLATESLQQLTTRTQRGSLPSVTVTVERSTNGSLWNVTWVDEDKQSKPHKPYVQISTAHLIKLLHLWKLHDPTHKQPCTTELDSTASKNNTDEMDPQKLLDAVSDPDAFRATLYACLARYDGLKGAGYQCAVPGSVFEAAAHDCGLGVTMECFASPFNCRYRNYCSAFPGVERRFGSCGNFFDDKDFNPHSGSFQANPPFVPETMKAMTAKLLRLLRNASKGALSFLVYVPAWGEGISFCTDLEQATPYNRASMRIPASDHAFCDGAQHVKKDETWRPSSWDTAVILLQNDLGAAQWPVTRIQLQTCLGKALRESVQQLPSNQTTIQGWERNGIVRGGGNRQHGKQEKQDNIQDGPTGYSKGMQHGVDGSKGRGKKRAIGQEKDDTKDGDNSKVTGKPRYGHFEKKKQRRSS